MPPPPEACRLGAQLAAKPQGGLGSVAGIAKPLHGIDWTQAVLFTPIADAVGVIGEVFFKWTPEVFAADSVRAVRLLAGFWVQGWHPRPEIGEGDRIHAGPEVTARWPGMVVGRRLLASR